MSNVTTLDRFSRGRFVGLLRVLGIAGSILPGLTGLAGTATYDFTTDPTTDTNIVVLGSNTQPWQSAGGNPGGFLAITYAADSLSTKVVFPDIDAGKIVTSFKFDADLRVGNSSDADSRPADGFSISFARGNDPLLPDPANDANFAGGLPEAGTTTGIAIGFDTWAGNTLPDGSDIEGIIVRVDNKTVLRQAMPTRNGACDDPTSLQTGKVDAAYWAGGGDATLPEAWATLCWKRLSVELDDQGRLTVSYKGTNILNQYQTTYFPSIGRLVLAGRTGGNNEQTHIDNITLTTIAVAADTEKPTVPTNLHAIETGALRVLLAWNPSTDDSGRVAYEIEQNATNLTATFVGGTNEVRSLSPTNAYTFRVRATDVSGNKSDWSAPVSVTTVALVPDTIYGTAQIYGTTDAPISGTTVDQLIADSRYPASPDRVAPVNGLQFGEPLFSDTYGENLGVRIAGTLSPSETGQYNFFIRSDDGSQLYLNTNGPAIPVADDASFIATETDCCGAFVEPGTLNTDATTSPTTATPIQLTAGQKYGILFLEKEGGGGDWGQVAWRKVGDTTPAGSLSAITYPVFTPETPGLVDPVGAVVNILQQPQAVTTPANETVSFNVNAQTASPYSMTAFYQWFRNGVAIPGASGTNYTIPFVAQTNNGAVYSVLVAVQGKSVTSSNATLTVNADTKAPTLVSTTSADTFNSITLKFSEPVTAPSATTAANYTLSGGATVSAAQLLNSTTVRLTTSVQTPNTPYTVTISNVADNAANVVAAGTTGTFTSFADHPGQVQIFFFNAIGGGTAIGDLTNALKFPNLPDETRSLTNLASPDSYGDNYGAMIRGYIAPTNTASYDFFLRSDDAGALFLNTTGEAPPDPLTSTPIAIETDCCEAFVEPGTMNDDTTTSATTTAPIALTAGKRYGITILMKEGGGGDYVQVAWRTAGDTTAAELLQPIPSAFIGSYSAGTTSGGGTTFTSVAKQGNNLVLAWQTGTLESADSVLGPWTPVANASSPATIPIAGGSKFYRLR